MSDTTTISKNIDTRDDQDFDFLREAGLEHIQAMSRKLWTDYNAHDPGITFLEVLCYAITDLGNRINLPMRDLLMPADATDSEPTGNFPTAKQILTTGPVSNLDYRKLFIDIEGVNNAFIRINIDYSLYRHCSQRDEPTEEFSQGKLSFDADLTPNYKKEAKFNLQGLYTILFEPTRDIRFLSDDDRTNRLNQIIETIKKRYHANRNLCEDLAEVNVIDALKLMVCGDIELERSANAIEVLTEVLFRVQEYLSPSIKRYSLDQLIEEGMAMENIYEGPILKGGFIRDDELREADLKKEVHLSDLIQIVSETPGVANIKELHMGKCGPKSDEVDLTKWKICIHPEADKVLRLCLDRTIQTMNLFKDVIPVDVNTEVVKERLAEKDRAYQKSLQLSYDDLPYEKSTYVDTGSYRTVQNDLPQLYGTGESGLSPSLSPQRHARAKQLKGYLLFFDQVLATYFEHLRNLGDLLSDEIGNESYFAGLVDGVKDFNELVKNESSYHEDVQSILSKLDDFDVRKNQFLDHLLARFAENMTQYTFAMLDDFGEDITGATLEHKSTLLREYPEISYNRAKGFNYCLGEDEAWNSTNVAGLKHRLARLLGLRDYTRSDIITYDYEIYQEHDDDEESELRWRILDASGDIMLSSSMHYHSKMAAEQEMWKSLTLAADKQHYQFLPTESGDKFYFNIIDETEEVVARHIQYYPSKAKARAEIDYISSYLSEKISEDGMFLFEDILFRPDKNDENRDEKLMSICMDKECTQCKPKDPYSLQLTIVLPGWTRRFSNLNFREYAEKLIRREVPAHLLCRICWIGNVAESEEQQESTLGGPMSQVENLYKKWLIKKMKSPHDQTDNEFLKSLVDLLHNLETVYPAGRLYDCSVDGKNKTDAPITLGKTKIGELKTQDYGND